MVLFGNAKNLGNNARQRRNRKKAIKTSRLDLYVVQVDQSGNLRSSRPCGHCMNVIKLLGIRRIFYSQNDGTIAKERVSDDTVADCTVHMQKEQIKMSKMFYF